LIEIDALAKACGLPVFRYHAFPPTGFDAAPLRPESPQAEPQTSPQAEASTPTEATPAPPIRAEPFLATPTPTAPPRVEPVFTAPPPAAPPAPEPPPPPVPSQTHAATSASAWLAQHGPVAHPPYPILQELASALHSGTPTMTPPGSRPSRRQARSAGRIVTSKIRSN
jgi:hypothetical protein